MPPSRTFPAQQGIWLFDRSGRGFAAQQSALLAEISEFDLDKRIWIILPARTKAAKERCIPPSDASLKILAYTTRRKSPDLGILLNRARARASLSPA
jgi:hypothetical protein